jgi:hypothetical protein
MRKLIPRAILVLAFGASSMMMAAAAHAQEWPLVAGDYWEVTGVVIKDGGGLKYANFLAGEWRENMEFSKSKGWIKDYMILGNAYARADEPDLFLITIMDSVVSGPEGEKRQQEYMAWKKKTVTQMETESGNRAEFREVKTNFLFQQFKFRK